MAKRKHDLSILPIHDNAYESVLSSLELRDNLQKTCQMVAKTFQADHCGLALFDSESPQGKVVAEYPDWDLLGNEIYFENVLEREKFTKTKKPLILGDLSKHITLEPVISFLSQHNVNFVVFFPVRHNKKVLGFFSLFTTKGPRKFTAEEINVFELLSEKATSAIEVALLSSYVTKTSTHLDELVSSSLDAVILIDEDKHITTFNKQAEEMFGYEAAEILGKTTACLHSDLDEAKNIWKTVSDEGKIVRSKVNLLHKNGIKIPVLLSASSVKDSEGNEIGQAGIMQSRLIEERLFSLIQATQAVSCSLKLDDVLQCIIESAITAFPTAEKGVIHLYDKETNRLIVRANKGYSPEVEKAVSFKRGEGRAGWVFENGRPLVIDNVQKNKEFQNINVTFNHPEVNEQKSTICVPLNRKGKVIGTISLDNLSVYNAFTTKDIDLLSTFADQVTIAIENAQLFEQIQRDLHIANNFYEISSKLYPTHDPNESLKLIATQVKKVMGALSVSITALDTAGRPYEKAQNGYDLPPKNWSKVNVRIGPIRRQKQWQNGRYFQQNRSS